MATAEQASSRQEREVIATAGIAWAYMAALQRSEFAVATSLLAVFQQLFNTHRGDIVATLSQSLNATQRAQFDGAVPRAVPVNGRFDAGTRAAFIALLNSLPQLRGAPFSSMPSNSAALGDWWWRTLAVRGQSASMLWSFDWAVRDASGADAAMEAATAADGYILGLTPETPAVATGYISAVETGNAPAQSVVHQAAQSAPRPTSFTPSVPFLTSGPASSSPTITTTRTVTTGPVTLVQATPPFWKEAWFFWSMLAAGGLLAGSFAYQTHRRGGFKKLWRRG